VTILFDATRPVKLGRPFAAGLTDSARPWEPEVRSCLRSLGYPPLQRR
jgi:hypothetical protein